MMRRGQDPLTEGMPWDPPVGGTGKRCWGEGCLEYPSKLAVTRARISGRKLAPIF